MKGLKKNTIFHIENELYDEITLIMNKLINPNNSDTISEEGKQSK